MLSGGQSEVTDGQPSQISGTDFGRVRNVTELFFFGEDKTLQRKKERKNFPNERESKDL